MMYDYDLLTIIAHFRSPQLSLISGFTLNGTSGKISLNAPSMQVLTIPACAERMHQRVSHHQAPPSI